MQAKGKKNLVSESDSDSGADDNSDESDDNELMNVKQSNEFN